MPKENPMKNFPDVHFGSADKPLPNWRDDDFENEPDDDEELEFTPDDVIQMLGFDPATDEDYEYSEPDQKADEREKTETDESGPI